MTGFYLLIFIIVDILLILDLLSYELIKHKGIVDNTSILLSLIPVFGFMYALNIESKNKRYELANVLSLNKILIKWVIYSLFLVIVWVDVSAIRFFYNKLFNLPSANISQGIAVYYIYSFFILVSIFVIQSITYEIMKTKGYTIFTTSLIALIPIFGVIVASFKKPNKTVLKSTIRKSYTLTEIVVEFMVYTEMLLVASLVVVPIIYIIGASFTNNTNDLPITIWPKSPSLARYVYLFKETKFNKWYLNTLEIALVNMIFGVIFITGAAYVLARFKFKGKKFGLITILVLQVFPSFMGLVAMFVLFETFGLLGKPLALSILYIGGSIPFNIWIIKGYLQNIPKELDESAMIDGANKLQIFFKIILPLSVPNLILCRSISIHGSVDRLHVTTVFIKRSQIGSGCANTVDDCGWFV